MYPSATASISNTDGPYEAEEEAVLQGTLYVPVRSTSKGTCSSTMVEIEKFIVHDWVSDAAKDDTELWEALSAEHCPPPPSSPTTTITTPSQSMNDEYMHMYVYVYKYNVLAGNLNLFYYVW